MHRTICYREPDESVPINRKIEQIDIVSWKCWLEFWSLQFVFFFFWIEFKCLTPFFVANTNFLSLCVWLNGFFVFVYCSIKIFIFCLFRLSSTQMEKRSEKNEWRGAKNDSNSTQSMRKSIQDTFFRCSGMHGHY